VQQGFDCSIVSVGSAVRGDAHNDVSMRSATDVGAMTTSALRTILDKGTREPISSRGPAVRRGRLALVPTFVAFTPWTTLESYEDLLFLAGASGAGRRVAPVQLAIRLLIPNGSRLLGRPELGGVVGEYDERLLSYRWTHSDPRVDDLQREVEALVRR